MWGAERAIPTRTQQRVKKRSKNNRGEDRIVVEVGNAVAVVFLLLGWMDLFHIFLF
jgi:hypothetical protein